MKLVFIGLFTLNIFLFNNVFANESTIVMLGDSTTLCDRNAPGKKITELVQAKLTESVKGTTFKVVNSGVGGSTAKEAVPRVQSSVIANKPDIVTISFGLNDTGKSTPEEFRKALETMIDAIQKDTKAKIILVTSSPFDNSRHAWKDKFAKEGGLDETMDAKFCQEMRTIATQKKIGLCDLHKKMSAAFKKDATLITKSILPDGVHLSDEGNELASGFLATDIAAVLKGGKVSTK